MNYDALIEESVSKLKQLAKQQSIARLKDRTRFLRYFKEGICKTQAQAGHLIGLQERQSQNLDFPR